MIDDFPDQDLNDWIEAYNAYRKEAFIKTVIDAAIEELVCRIFKGELRTYTIIIVQDVLPSKYTVYYWKYTSYHINQPMHHIPNLIEEAAESNG